ncbi:MAG: TRAP transporter substrate-binding protein DctP [Planctomycetes bacterium]|nr:TRAP transporter substrate-binding protein DctP [Planctomycetota bacterium]
MHAFWLVLALTAPSVSSETVEIKLATQAPEQSVWGRAMTEMAAEIDEATEGRVRLKCYANGVQGDEKTVLRKIRVGQLHAAAFIGSGLAQICKDSLALQFPLQFENRTEVDEVLSRVGPLLEKQCQENGYEVLAWPHLGFSYLFSTRPVGSVAELRKAKPWLIENDRLSKELFEALSITPVTVGVTDVLPGLQSGLIDTVFSPPVGLVALQWHTKVKHRVDLAINYSVGVIAVSQRTWKKIPEDLQRTVRDVIQRRVTELNEKVGLQNREALEVLEKRGMKCSAIGEDDRRELREATKRIEAKLRDKEFSGAVLDAVREALQELRKKS